LAAYFTPAGSCRSSTSSQRELYVRELRSAGLPVDVYGDCEGDLKCPQGDCKAAADGYKFVLAFEDALCRDYVTQAFFSAMSEDAAAVPVVLAGGANHSLLAPPHSFVDAGRFAGPEQLARFLKLLDADDAR